MELRRPKIALQDQSASSATLKRKSPGHSVSDKMVPFSAGEVPFDIRLFPGGLPEPAIEPWSRNLRAMILIGGALLAWTPILWLSRLL